MAGVGQTGPAECSSPWEVRPTVGSSVSLCVNIHQLVDYVPNLYSMYVICTNMYESFGPFHAYKHLDFQCSCSSE